MTVGELLTRSSAMELTEWQMYERMHGPLGAVRGDWQAAQIAAVIANANSKRKVKLRDMLLSWGSGRKATSDEEMERVGRMLALTYGGEWSDAGGEH